MITYVDICSQFNKRKQWAPHGWCATCEVKWHKEKGVTIELLDEKLLDAYETERLNDFIEAL